jgi:hypothetical protein
MKVRTEDFLKSQRKTGLQPFVEKQMARDALVAKEPKKDEPVKTFVLSPTGGEIHRGESVVDRVSKPETLKQKIARFERLAQRVRQSRELAYAALQDSIPDCADNADEFDFEDGDFVDDFGDVIEPITPIKPVTGDQDGEQPAAPQSQAGEKPIEEPVTDPEPQQD